VATVAAWTGDLSSCVQLEDNAGTEQAAFSALAAGEQGRVFHFEEKLSEAE
jgi:hypothetical protein